MDVLIKNCISTFVTNLTPFQLIKDNLSKADRAYKKIEEEEDKCLFYELEIENLRKQVSELESRTEFLKPQLLNYSIFEVREQFVTNNQICKSLS